MSTDSPAPPTSTSLRVATLVVAVVETLGALFGLTSFRFLSEYQASFTQYLLFVGIAIFPFLAIAALIFAIKGDVRRAIMAMAAMVIVNFFTDELPSMFVHGLEFLGGWGFTQLSLFAQMVVFPILAVVSFLLAYRNERLWLALILASLSTALHIIGVIAFAIGVSIYGF
jgi:hypothetical protein